MIFSLFSVLPLLRSRRARVSERSSEKRKLRLEYFIIMALVAVLLNWPPRPLSAMMTNTCCNIFSCYRVRRRRIRKAPRRAFENVKANGNKNQFISSAQSHFSLCSSRFIKMCSLQSEAKYMLQISTIEMNCVRANTKL